MVYCSKCGALVPDDAGFCPGCGAPAGPGVVSDGGENADRQARRQIRREMRAGREEWHRSPEYNLQQSVMSGLFIVLLGGLMLLSAWEVTPLVTWSNFFAYLLVGGGIILFIPYLMGFFMPGRAHGGFGTLIWGIVLAAVGAAWLFMYFFNLTQPLWPLIIVGGGVLVIAAGVASYMARRA